MKVAITSWSRGWIRLVTFGGRNQTTISPPLNLLWCTRKWVHYLWNQIKTFQRLAQTDKNPFFNKSEDIQALCVLYRKMAKNLAKYLLHAQCFFDLLMAIDGSLSVPMVFEAKRTEICFFVLWPWVDVSIAEGRDFIGKILKFIFIPFSPIPFKYSSYISTRSGSYYILGIFIYLHHLSSYFVLKSLHPSPQTFIHVNSVHECCIVFKFT